MLNRWYSYWMHWLHITREFHRGCNFHRSSKSKPTWIGIDAHGSAGNWEVEDFALKLERVTKRARLSRVLNGIEGPCTPESCGSEWEMKALWTRIVAASAGTTGVLSMKIDDMGVWGEFGLGEEFNIDGFKRNIDTRLRLQKNEFSPGTLTNPWFELAA